MILTHKLTLAAVLALGVAAPPARTASDPATAQIGAYAAPAPASTTPPETPQPDPAVSQELERAAERLAAEIATDRIAADIAFQLGRADAIVSQMEHDR